MFIVNEIIQLCVKAEKTFDSRLIINEKKN